MKIYLVGGAVRDMLLKETPREKDWLVVGATPETMKALGFKQVGRSFPVFLHPLTNEEYALARSEKKSGPGYLGFTFDFSPETTLEQDLLRRDLTINAMAIDPAGHLIDLFGGQKDLKARCFRHVSEAFSEDPLRVLRVARFSCHHWGATFTLDPSTEKLLQRVIEANGLSELSPSRIWMEWQKSLELPRWERWLFCLHHWNALSSCVPSLAEALSQVSDFNHFISAMQAISWIQEARVRYAWFARLLQQQLGRPLSQKLMEGVNQALQVPGNFAELSGWATKETPLLWNQLKEGDPRTWLLYLDQWDFWRRPEGLIPRLLILITEASPKLLEPAALLSSLDSVKERLLLGRCTQGYAEILKKKEPSTRKAFITEKRIEFLGLHLPTILDQVV